MLKVQIKRQSNVTHEAQFTSQVEVDQWIAQCEAVQAWGKPERWLQDTPMNPLSEEEKTRALEQRVSEVMGESVTEYLLPAEYSIEIEDVTAKLEQELTNAVALSYLAATDWYVTRQIEDRGANTSRCS